MLKRHMTPLRPGGQATVHQGKGARSAHMPHREEVVGPTRGLNDFAKATPMANPAPTTPLTEPPTFPMGGV